MESTQPVPWKMADAPREYTGQMLANIVGIELTISRIVGKLKASQNRSKADRNGVVAGLEAGGESAMAGLVRSSAPDLVTGS
jgi:transcriptional regulator